MSESLGNRMKSLRGEARLAAIGEVVSQWRASGKSQTAFCREVGVATVTLGRWLRRLEVANAPKAGAPVLEEVGVHESRGGADYELVLPGGTTVRVPSNFREGDLARLLGVLSAAC